MKQGRFLRLPRQQVDQREAGRIAVFQILQGFAEHDGADPLVAIDQGEARLRLIGKRRGDDGQQRGDAGARGKPDAVAGARGAGGEASVGRHHVDRVAGPQRLHRPARKAAAFDRLDANLDLALLHVTLVRTADRIAAAFFTAVQHGPQGEELARPEIEVAAQRLRHLEGENRGAGSLGADAMQTQRMKVDGHVTLAQS